MKPRWFVIELDSNWVRCRHCRKDYRKKTVQRRNKCPNCKLDNYGCMPSKKGDVT